MKKVGEIGFGGMAQAKRATKGMVDRNVRVTCRDCGCVAWFSEAAARTQGGKDENRGKTGVSWSCKTCKAKGEKEFQQAIIALAKRKGLI